MGVKGGGLNSQEGYGKGIILDLKRKTPWEDALRVVFFSLTRKLLVVM